MLRRTFAICCAAFSLSGCVSGPQVSPCVLDPESGVLWCYPYASQNDNDGYKVKIADAGNYTCFSPDDAQRLVEWIKRHSKKRGQ